MAELARPRWVVTLSRVLRGEGILNKRNVAPKFRDGGFREEREGNCPASCRQLCSRHGVAHHGRSLLQAALPVRFARVAEYQGIRVETGGLQDGARQFQKIRPARCNS